MIIHLALAMKLYITKVSFLPHFCILFSYKNINFKKVDDAAVFFSFCLYDRIRLLFLFFNIAFLSST